MTSSDSSLSLLSISDNINERDYNYQTILHRSIIYQDSSLFTKLLSTSSTHSSLVISSTTISPSSSSTLDYTIRDKDNRTAFALAILRYDHTSLFYSQSNSILLLIQLGIHTITQQLETIINNKYNKHNHHHYRTDFNILPEIIAKLSGTYESLINGIDKDILQCFTIFLSIYQHEKIQLLLQKINNMTTSSTLAISTSAIPNTQFHQSLSSYILSPRQSNPCISTSSFSYSTTSPKPKSSIILGLDEPDRLGRTTLMLLCNIAGNSDIPNNDNTLSINNYLYSNEIDQLITLGCNINKLDNDDNSVLRYTIKGITKYLLRIKDNYTQYSINPSVLIPQRYQLLNKLIIQYKCPVYREDIEVLYEYKNLFKYTVASSSTNSESSIVHPADIARFIQPSSWKSYMTDSIYTTKTNIRSSSTGSSNRSPSSSTHFASLSSPSLSSSSINTNNSNKQISFHQILSEDAGFSDSLRYRYGGAIICEPFHVLAAAAKQDNNNSITNNNNQNNNFCYNSSSSTIIKVPKSNYLSNGDVDEDTLLQIALLESLETGHNNNHTNLTSSDDATIEKDKVTNNVLSEERTTKLLVSNDNTIRTMDILTSPSVNITDNSSSIDTSSDKSNNVIDSTNCTTPTSNTLSSSSSTKLITLTPLDIRLYTCRTAVWRRRRYALLYYHSLEVQE